MKLSHIITAIAILALACGSLTACHQINHHAKTEHVSHVHRARKRHTQERTSIDIFKPSEAKPYPKKLNTRTDRIVVSIPKQRVYIQHHNKTIYTMLASTGSHNRTPRGTFHVQQERGDYFYSAKEHEGARYYTSWKDHGVYLFHATPNNQKKQIIKPVVRQLGKRPSSHGCVHLTLPDARYIEAHAPIGLKVIIH